MKLELVPAPADDKMREMPGDFAPTFIETETEVRWEGDPGKGMTGLGFSKVGFSPDAIDTWRGYLRLAVWQAYELVRLERLQIERFGHET